MGSGKRLAELRLALAHTGTLVERAVTLPASGATLRVAHPTDTDLLLDHVVDDPEENLPYWSEIWPSGVALAEAVLAAPALVHGRRVLELGCGLGVTALAALQAGAELLVTDYAREALDLCRYNALLNGCREPAAVRGNWRDAEPLLAVAGSGYPVVLAADVLYESRDIEPLLALLPRLLEPGGLLWLAEPGRPVAMRFVALAEERGWRVEEARQYVGPWPDPGDDAVVVTVRRMRAPSSCGVAATAPAQPNDSRG